MNMDDMVIVSVDDHIVEPPTMFDAHFPQRLKDQAPKLVRKESGATAWYFQDIESQSSALNAVVTWPREDWALEPMGLSQVRPGAYDVHARVEDLSVNGIAASINFPSFAGFSGGFFLRMPDKDLAAVAVRAYNDWHIDEWCAAHPGRFIPMAVSPLWDVEFMAEEIRGVGKKGARSMTFTEAPHDLGLPSLFSGYWDPAFKAASEEGLVLSIHVGSSSNWDAAKTAPDGPEDIRMVLANIQFGNRTLADLMFSPVLPKFPELRIALSESGAGWIPTLLERFERHVVNQTWTGENFGGMNPTELFRRHFLTCSIVEEVGLVNRNMIGVDNMSVEVDYPHSDTTWPKTPEELWREFQAASCSDVEIEKITHENALRFYGYDLFSYNPKESLTVGALRRAAAHVDISDTTKEEYRNRYELAAAGRAE